MHLNIFDEKQLEKFVRKRHGETKLGQKIKLISNCKNIEDLKRELNICNANYVLLGLPEDIGVRANFGRGGAHTAWHPALESLLNTQSNIFFEGSELLVLGNVMFDDLMEQSQNLSPKNSTDLQTLRNLTSEVDKRVFEIVDCIAACNKIAIVVGGGHNNAYPIIKGNSNALNQKINVINIDAHTDFRPLEGRHSGNGFSYAYSENFMESYHVVGIHESYCTDAIQKNFEQNKQLHMFTYEDIYLREKISLEEILNSFINKNSTNLWGLEIDLDSIQNIPSSAKTSSGMLPLDVRKFIYKSVAQLKPNYLHIAEGAPILSHIKTDNKTGKLISYLISDFIKAHQSS